MKVIFGLVIVAVVSFFAWQYWQNQRSGDNVPLTVAPDTSRPNPENATFDFEDGPITLHKGEASKELAPGSGLTLDTNLTNDIAYGDISGDGKNDAAVLLVQSGGGSGVFIYVAAYVSGNVAYKGTNAIFIGDRITPKSISIDKSGVITVSYLDRKTSEPLAAEPTVLKSKSFLYRQGNLEER